MAKYKVKHTSIMHNKKVYGEGSEIELTDVQAERLADFVELIPEQAPPKPKTQTSKEKTTTKKSETKTEIKSDAEPGTETKTAADETLKEDGSDGGSK